MISLRQVTKENIKAILKLKVRDDQKDQVATNAESIAEGTYTDVAWFRAIYWEEQPVGFVMLSLEPEKNEYWIWRYMIDKGEQGKGFGKAAIEKAIDFMRTMPGIKEVLLSYVPKPQNGADGFYLKCGFIDTGRKEHGEIIMKYPIT